MAKRHPAAKATKRRSTAKRQRPRSARPHGPEEVFWQIAQRISAATGQDFFRALVENLAQTLPVDFALIGEVSSVAQHAIESAAVYGDGGWLPNFTYDLSGTPCAHVIAGKECCYRRGVAKNFPADRWIVEQGIEGYVGVPLLDSAQRCIGLLAVLDRRAVKNPEAVLVGLRIFAARAAAELERKRADDAVRKSEEFHRAISDIAADYAYSCRVDADGSIHVDALTQGFTRVTGYLPEELEARGGWQILIHPDDAARTAAGGESLLRGEPLEREIRLLTKAGETRWIRYTARPFFDTAQNRVTRLVGAVSDITERKRADETLQQYARTLQALSHRLLDVQEQERRHLARELHDEIGQLLTGTIYALENCRRLPNERISEGLAGVQEQVKDLTARVRDLSLRLRPTMLDDFGLLPATLWHIERFIQQTHIQIAFEHAGLDRRFEADVETALYRILQEGLTNVARHAGVRHAQVRLRCDDGRLVLQIRDRGAGFDPPGAVRPGVSSGLSGMQERASLLGGTFRVESQRGAGTAVTAEFPVAAFAVAASADSAAVKATAP